MASVAQQAATEQPKETVLEKVTRWHNLKAQVAKLVADEAALRLELFNELHPNAPEKGSSRATLGFGKDLKATTKLNYSVSRDGLDAAKSSLPIEVLATVIKYRPEVNEAGLASVTDPQHKAVLATFITSKPGLPTLEIVDVKKRG